MEQFEINNGSSAVFQCEASAVPEHIVFWTFTNSSGSTQSIISTTEPDTNKFQIKRVRGIGVGFGELTVLDVQYEDRGRYTCTAMNSLGIDISNANLTVHGELRFGCTVILTLRVGVVKTSHDIHEMLYLYFSPTECTTIICSTSYLLLSLFPLFSSSYYLSSPPTL